MINIMIDDIAKMLCNAPSVNHITTPHVVADYTRTISMLCDDGSCEVSYYFYKHMFKVAYNYNLEHRFALSQYMDYSKLGKIDEYTISSCVYKNSDNDYHREDGPAIEYANGDKEWWINGERHRVDGPAIEWPDGSKEWWVDGERHREDGPAREYADGGKEWWVNGKRHREDGPAVELADGYKEWWVEGKQIK